MSVTKINLLLQMLTDVFELVGQGGQLPRIGGRYCVPEIVLLDKFRDNVVDRTKQVVSWVSQENILMAHAGESCDLRGAGHSTPDGPVNRSWGMSHGS